MKKILVSLMAVMAAVTFSSCMGGGTVKDTAPAAVKANESYAMNAEKAAGVYNLDTMDAIGETTKESYTLNTVTLNKDGTFSFNVAAQSIDDTSEGTYTIKANGTITFTVENKAFAIVSKNETVVCDGNNLTAEGKLGRATVTMNYAKVTAEEPKEKTEEQAE